MMDRKNRGMGTGTPGMGDRMTRLVEGLRIGIFGIYEGVILELLADAREADIDTLCRLADVPGVEVHGLHPDEEHYAVMVEKDTLAKLIVISELKGVGLGHWLIPF